MFIGDNRDTHQAATQKLMDAVVHLRRASDALMAVQPLLSEPNIKEKVRSMRVQTDSNSIFLDSLFQEAAQRFFA